MLVFLLPFVVYLLVQSLEPARETVDGEVLEKPGGATIGLAIGYRYYPLVYAAKLVLTLAAIWFVLPGYGEFPIRVRPLAVVVGVVGIVVWVGLCKLDVEHAYLQPALDKVGLGWIIGSGSRSAYNPFEQLAGQPVRAWAFLAIRFLGLAAVVPLVEEFFLRGFLMRFVIQSDWWKVPFGRVTPLAVIVGTAVPMLMHPGELLAAAVWFSMVTWLMVRTRNLWDCIAAHAVTNLLLGVYVVASGDWHLM